MSGYVTGVMGMGPVPINAATFDPNSTSGVTLSNGNLTANETASNGGAHVFNTSAHTSGKYYYEMSYDVLAGSIGGGMIGVGLVGTTYANFAGDINSSIQFSNGNINANTVNFYNNGARAVGDIVGIAVDLDNRTIWFKKVSGTPGLWNGAVANGNPTTNLNGVPIIAGSIIPYVTFNTNSGDVFTANFGSSSFTGAVPSGFSGGWPP